MFLMMHDRRNLCITLSSFIVNLEIYHDIKTVVKGNYVSVDSLNIYHLLNCFSLNNLGMATAFKIFTI